MHYQTRSTKILIVTVLMLAIGLVFAACAPAPTATPVPPTAAPATTAPQPTAAPSGASAIKVGLVTDVGGPDDKSFNATSIEGLNRAIKELGISPDSKYLQSRQPTDYEKNLQEFVTQKYNMIITVGFLLGLDTAKAAKANPDVSYAIVDYAYPDCAPGAVEGKDCGSATEIPNVLGLTFRTEQAAFLAGYLAAGVSQTKKVGTYGGVQIPPVEDFMWGFQAGVNYWNQKHNDKVELLGWDSKTKKGVFTNTFTDPAKGKEAALSLIDEGADVILPVAGLTGNGTFAAAKEKNVLGIGVDTDQCISLPGDCPVILTSVRKNLDNAVFYAIQSYVNGTFKGGTYSGTLANDGVSLAPYHEQASKVSADMQKELDQIKQDVIDGKIDIKALSEQ
jgi:basic membrane protein A